MYATIQTKQVICLKAFKDNKSHSNQSEPACNARANWKEKQCGKRTEPMICATDMKEM